MNRFSKLLEVSCLHLFHFRQFRFYLGVELWVLIFETQILQLRFDREET